MTALAGHDGHPAHSDLIDEKAWQYLGVTGQEFRRAWYAGDYRNDPRPEVASTPEARREALERRRTENP